MNIARGQIARDGTLMVGGDARIVRNEFSGHDDVRRVEIAEGVRCIDEVAFARCDSLEELILPDSLEVIKDRAFYDCTSLRRIRFGRRLVMIGHGAFIGCITLSEFRLPSMLHTIGAHAFAGCSSIFELDLPASVRNVGNEAFRECTALTSVTIRSDISSAIHVEQCGGVTLRPESGIFTGCTGLRSVVVMDDVHRLPSRCFAACRGLVDVSIPASCTDVDNDVFDEVPAMKGARRYGDNGRKLLNVFGRIDRLDVPFSLREIGDGALSGALPHRVEIPDDSHLQRIGRSAFSPYDGHWIIVPPSVRFYGGTDPMERVLLPSVCNASAVNDLMVHYRVEDYGLLRSCVDEARKVVKEKTFPLEGLLSVLRRFQSVRLTCRPSVGLEIFLDQMDGLSRLMDVDVFYGVSNEDSAMYLDAVLSNASDLRNARSVLLFVVKVLRDERGMTGEGRRRRIALVRRMMPFFDAEPERRLYGGGALPPLDYVGGAVCHDSRYRDEDEWERFRRKTRLEPSGSYFEDDDQQKAIQIDAAGLFMLRYTLLVQRPHELMAGYLMANGAYRCLYELHREAPQVIEFKPATLALACESMDPENAAALVNRMSACGEADLFKARPPSGFGYLWHAFKKMAKPTGGGPWRNALTDALINAGCDRDADCYCGLTFNEIANG